MYKPKHIPLKNDKNNSRIIVGEVNVRSQLGKAKGDFSDEGPSFCRLQ